MSKKFLTFTGNSMETRPFLHQGKFVAASKANRAKGFASKKEEEAYIQSVLTSFERRRGVGVQDNEAHG